jgi:transposase
MFVKKKRNRSGSTSVVIVDKSSGNYKELVSMGTSKDAKEINKFYELGKQWIKERTGLVEFDFNDHRKQTEQFIHQIDQLLINGTELLLTRIYNFIGFSKISDDIFRHLVLSRLSFPGSKRATVEYLKDYYDFEVDINKVYRYLDETYNSYKHEVQMISVNHTKQILGGTIGVVFYDVTTLYFESDNEDDLRKNGFSKDGKHQNPQIVLGLLVSKDGYPLTYQIFEGNKFEGHTMMPIINDFEKEYDIKKSIVVADAGLMSKQNIEDLERNNYQYIIGAKLKGESEDTKACILSQNIADGEFVELKKGNGRRLIIGYSEKRAKKDYQNRKKGLARLEKLYKTGKLTKSSINKRGYNKYLKMGGQVQVQIDHELFEQDCKWDGLKGYLTNTKLKTEEVYSNYSNLWKIENAFKVAKSKIEIRPMFHFTPKRIEAHVCICFVAYKVYKELERQLKEMQSPLSPDKAISIAKTICTIKVKVPKSTETIEKVLLLTDKQKQLAKLFGF